jgi:hypothetical protein
LIAAAGLPAQVVGVALLNSAGQFGNANSKTEETEETLLQKSIIKPLKEIFQRIVLGFLFWQAKQPARVESVLKSVCHFLPNLTRAFISSLMGISYLSMSSMSRMSIICPGLNSYFLFCYET